MSDSKVLNFEVLLKFNNCNKARELLHTIARQVNFILNKRHWVVHNFCEFCPKDKKLLGLNIDRGETIRIRLRQCNNEHEFIPLEELIDTMLHEIAHIEEANHSKKFYKLWDDLRDEWEQNAIKNNNDGNNVGNENGQRLNPTSHNPSSMRDARIKALAAAEKRAKLSELMSIGPNKLTDTTPLLSPKEAVRIATLTRLNGSNWCGIDDTSQTEIELEPWSCEQCTMFNAETFDYCSACNFPKSRPKKRASIERWNCAKCTMSNLQTSNECSTCGYNGQEENYEAIQPDTHHIELDNNEEEVDNEEVDNEEVDNEEVGNEEVDNEEVDNEEVVNNVGEVNKDVSEEINEETNDEKRWICEKCTMFNSILLKECSICGFVPPKDTPLPFENDEQFENEFENDEQFENEFENDKWTCSECTFVNSFVDVCEMCNIQKK